MNDLLEKNVQVKHNQELHCLEVTFTGYIPYDTMVETLQYEYAMIRYYKLTRCTVDLRAMGIYAPGVSELVKNEWFKRVVAEGIQQVAFVVPESTFGQLSMNKAHESAQANTGLITKYFQDLPSAYQWMGTKITPLG